jgi:hypothetical protein
VAACRAGSLRDPNSLQEKVVSEQGTTTHIALHGELSRASRLPSTSRAVSTGLGAVVERIVPDRGELRFIDTTGPEGPGAFPPAADGAGSRS